MNTPANALLIRRQLTRLARTNGEDLQTYIQRYAHERLLYRLGQSEHADRFILTRERPIALTEKFASDQAKLVQWAAFIRRAQALDPHLALADVIAQVEELVLPPTLAASRGAPFTMVWKRGGPWQPAE